MFFVYKNRFLARQIGNGHVGGEILFGVEGGGGG